MKNLVTIVSVSDVLKDKNGRDFKIIELSNPTKTTVVDETTGEILIARIPAKRAKINAYKESYLDDKPHFLWDSKVGEVVAGEIVTREVMPYEINERAVNTYTTAVFGNTDDKKAFEIEIERTFKNNGHPIMEELKNNEAPVKNVLADIGAKTFQKSDAGMQPPQQSEDVPQPEPASVIADNDIDDTELDF